jgi:hypothetical protein
MERQTMFKQGLLLKKHKRQKRLRKLKQKSKLTASAPTKVQACTIRELAAGQPRSDSMMLKSQSQRSTCKLITTSLTLEANRRNKTPLWIQLNFLPWSQRQPSSVSSSRNVRGLKTTPYSSFKSKKSRRQSNSSNKSLTKIKTGRMYLPWLALSLVATAKIDP